MGKWVGDIRYLFPLPSPSPRSPPMCRACCGIAACFGAPIAAILFVYEALAGRRYALRSVSPSRALSRRNAATARSRRALIHKQAEHSAPSPPALLRKPRHASHQLNPTRQARKRLAIRDSSGGTHRASLLDLMGALPLVHRTRTLRSRLASQEFASVCMAFCCCDDVVCALSVCLSLCIAHRHRSSVWFF